MAPPSRGRGRGRGGSSSSSRTPHRTTQLPSSLRTELEQLGHLQPASKVKGSRKMRRKAEREAKKGPAHRGGKRQREDATEEDAGKKRRVEREQREESDEEVVEEKVEAATPKHQTPLEKLLAKQEGRADPAVAVERKKSKVETNEDREIAWLEAKLGKGKASTGEFQDDGLDDLFDGLNEIEQGVFGTKQKDYAALLKSHPIDLDTFSQSGSESEGEAEEYGISDDEGLEEPSDDDTEEDAESEGEEAVWEGIEESEEGSEEEGEEESGSGNEEEDEEEEESGSEEDDDEEWDSEADEDELMREMEGWEGEEGEGMTMTFGADGEVVDSPPVPSDPTPSTSTSAPPTTRYIPPHLRQALASTALPIPSSTSTSTDLPPDPRLTRLLLSSLNKLSPSNISPILTSILSLYTSHPRALVSQTLVRLLLELVGGKEAMGEQLVVSYAALVAALRTERTVGGVVETVVARVVEGIEAEPPAADETFGEAGVGSKEKENLVGFLCEMVNFGVVGSGLVFELVKGWVTGEGKEGKGMGEAETELVVKVVKRLGQQLRSDDPAALKDIIGLVKKRVEGAKEGDINSRTKFMLESLTNLKNNKFALPGVSDKKGGAGAKGKGKDAGLDMYGGLKKFLSGLKKGGSAPDPLRLTLSDLHSSASKGKWWQVGAAWGGDPLLDNTAPLVAGAGAGGEGGGEEERELRRLAKKQGMNTEVRKSVFGVLMSSEDYVDAVERLVALGLSDVQQREIARVLLQCCGNEKTYNPYYTLVAHRLCAKSHSFQITLQYCLWDFLRELGETKVGGEEMVKGLESGDGGGGKVSKRRIEHLAKLYAWCVAKEGLGLGILKPVPFARAKPQTTTFLRTFFTSLLISTQSPSPALILTTLGTRRDRDTLEKVFVRIAGNAQLVRGLLEFFEGNMVGIEEEGEMGEKEGKIVRWGVKVVLDTLGLGGAIVDVSGAAVRSRKSIIARLRDAPRRFTLPALVAGLWIVYYLFSAPSDPFAPLPHRTPSAISQPPADLAYPSQQPFQRDLSAKIKRILDTPILSYSESLKIEEKRCPTTELQMSVDQIVDKKFWRDASGDMLSVMRRRVLEKVLSRLGAERGGGVEEGEWKRKFGDGRRGIVYLGGNTDTAKRILTSLQILRHHGCTLPVEIWGFRKEFAGLGKKLREKLLEDGGVTLREIKSKAVKGAHKQFQIKGEAMANSAFSEILYLDSDNFVLRDPTFLFDSPIYKKEGVVIWPDYTRDAPSNPVWRLTNTPCDPTIWQAETGQFLINKLGRDGMNLAALLAAQAMQEDWKFWWKLSGGDKDTFRYGFYILGLTYTPAPHYLAAGGEYIPSYKGHTFCGHTMLQRGLSPSEWDLIPRGSFDEGWKPPKNEAPPLFVHANLLKASGCTVKKWFLGQCWTYERGNTWSALKTATPPYHEPINGVLSPANEELPHIQMWTYKKHGICCDPWDMRTVKNEGYNSGAVKVEDWGKAWGGMLRGFEDMYFDYGGLTGP